VAADDHHLALDLDVVAARRDHLAAPHSGGEIEERRVVAFAGQSAGVGLRLNDPEQRSQFVIGARLRNPLLFELREEDQVNNVVTKYGSKEIKITFRDRDEFKALTEQPGRN